MVGTQSFGISFVSCEIDARPGTTGGNYRFVFSHPEAKQPMAFFGHYIDVAPNARLVWTNDEDGGNGAVTTVTFEERDGKTLLTVTDTTGAPDMSDEQFAQLDALLARQRNTHDQSKSCRLLRLARRLRRGRRPEHGQSARRDGPDMFQWFFPTRILPEHASAKATAARRASTTTSPRALHEKASAPSSWAATCSAPCAARGRTTAGKAGGATNPPYHAPTFVLTHHPRPPIKMEGGTTFHFVTDGIESALKQARAAAGAKDIKIAGGVETVRQYIQAGHVDEIHLAMAPVAIGQGESLFSGLDLRALGYRTVEHVATERATHIVLAK